MKCIVGVGQQWMVTREMIGSQCGKLVFVLCWLVVNKPGICPCMVGSQTWLEGEFILVMKTLYNWLKERRELIGERILKRRTQNWWRRKLWRKNKESVVDIVLELKSVLVEDLVDVSTDSKTKMQLVFTHQTDLTGCTLEVQGRGEYECKRSSKL